VALAGTPPEADELLAAFRDELQELRTKTRIINMYAEQFLIRTVLTKI
jgi:hypothetical protein